MRSEVDEVLERLDALFANARPVPLTCGCGKIETCSVSISVSLSKRSLRAFTARSRT